MRDTSPARRSVLEIVRGVFRGAEQRQMQRAEADLYAGETRRMEHFEPYGFTSRALAGAEIVAVAPGGSRSHLITIVVADRRYRLTTLAEGEVALHDDQGQVIHLKRDMIEIVRPSGQVIEMQDDPRRIRVLDGRRRFVVREDGGVHYVQMKIKASDERDDAEPAPIHLTLKTEGDPIVSSHPVVDGEPDPNPED